MSSENIAAVFLSDANAGPLLETVLSHQGFRVVLIRSSEELQQVMNQQRIDALVIEHELPGFLTGIDILERLKKQRLNPTAVLIGPMDAEHAGRAQALGVHQLQDWKTEPERIVQLLKSSLTAASQDEIQIPAAARKLVQQSDFIRPLPQLIVRLAYYLGDKQASTAEMAKDISADPKITAELLRIINSSAFGLRNQIVKVADAVAVLGIRRTASLIMMSAVQTVQSGFDRILSNDMLRWHRQHTLLTASSAAAFARLANQVSKDQAYTLALLQNLGVLVMAHHFNPVYPRILDRCRTIALLQLDVCERQEFSLTHADVSAALLQKWNLPASMVALVLDHHTDKKANETSRVSGSFLHVMRAGEAVANMSDVPSPQRNAHLQSLLKQFGNPAPDDIRNCLIEATLTAREMGKVFNVQVPQGELWDALVQQLTDEVQEPELAGAV